MSSLLLISFIIVLTKAAIFSTGKVDIINPDITAPGTEVHNASITITINNETNSVELHMIRHAPQTATSNFVWTGFGFDYLPYNGATYHNNSYAIILDYDVDNTPSVSEYTLGYDDIDNTPLDPPQTEGVLYPFKELTILSDVTNGDMREVIATRPINGTFTFLNTQIINNYQIIVTAAIHNRNPTYKNSLRHQSNSDDRNFTTATFELVPTQTPTMSPTVECNVFQSTSNTTHLRLILTINCPLNIVTLDVTYNAYDNNWFGVVFNDIMDGDAVIYTIGKATDINQFPRAESLYFYRLSGKTVNSVTYTPQLDWSQIQSQITDNGIHIIYQQHLSNTAWDASTRNIVFKYAYGNTPELTQHIFRSDTTFTFNLQTLAPTAQPTQSPTAIPSLRPSTSLPTTEKPSTSPSHSPSMSPSQSPTTMMPTTSRPTPVIPTTANPSVPPSFHPSLPPTTIPPTTQPTEAPSLDPSAAPTLHPTASPIKCPNGDVLTGTQDTDDLGVYISLNCSYDTVRIYIEYLAYADNWFGLVFNDDMHGDAVVYTIGTAARRVFLGLHSYDLLDESIDGVVYNDNNEWNELYVGSQDGGLYLVYENKLNNTPWDGNTTNVVFRYAIGTVLLLQKHVKTSNTFNLKLRSTATKVPTITPTIIPTTIPTTVPTATPTTAPTTIPTIAPTTTAPSLPACPDGDTLSGSMKTEHLQISMTIFCELEQIKLDIAYPRFNYTWFGLVFNDEMSGYALVYTKGKLNDRTLLLYTYDISKPEIVDNVVYHSGDDWTEIISNMTADGLFIQYANVLDKTPFDGRTASVPFRYVIGYKLSLEEHRFHSAVQIIHFREYIPSNTSMPTPVPTSKPYINASDITVCNATHSCSDKIVDCRSDGGECGLYCTDPFSCENAVYFCSDRATECNVKCLAVGSCKDAQINCAANNKNCVVVSEETNSLQNAIINGAENNSLTVNCSHSINGCVETVINAHLSSKLTMDCRGIRTCENIDIYCPEYGALHGENVKNCVVIGEGAGSETAVSFHDALQIHAVNSWDDIDLSSYLNVNIQHGSKMYCGEDFGEAECDITNPSNMFEWNCMDIASKCYRQIDSYHTIRCDAGVDGECYGTEIHCYDVDDIAQFGGCRIKCNAVHSCSGSKIECFDDKPCILECNGQNSCAEHVILQCPDNSDCEIQCNGANSCQYSTILCPNNNETGYECIVRANGVDSIRDSHISSGNNTYLNVDCAARESCKNARFGAGNASYLQIDCKDQESGSCENMAVECPQFNETNQEENCYVIGGGENEKHINLSFFCVNGWTDINLDAYVGFLQYNSSKTANTMYCRGDYSESCTMYSLERNLFCQCPDDQSDTALNWVIIICVGIGALFVVLFATVIICGLIEKEKKKYTKLESEYDQEIDVKKNHVPAPDGSDRLHN